VNAGRRTLARALVQVCMDAGEASEKVAARERNGMRTELISKAATCGHRDVLSELHCIFLDGKSIERSSLFWDESSWEKQGMQVSSGGFEVSKRRSLPSLLPALLRLSFPLSFVSPSRSPSSLHPALLRASSEKLNSERLP
jgi:hypothetical protein